MWLFIGQIRQNWLDKKNKLLFVLGACVVGFNGISFLYGFYPFFIWTWPITVVSFLVGCIVSILCLIITVVLIIKRRPFLRFLIIWLLLGAIIVFVSGYYCEIAGAYSAYYFAGPNLVLQEARTLIQTCQQSSNLNSACGYISEYPPAIKRVYPEMVYVDQKFVVIGKVGLIHPDGFVIFLDGDGPSEGTHVYKINNDLYWIYGE